MKHYVFALKEGNCKMTSYIAHDSVLCVGIMWYTFDLSFQ